MTILKKFLFEKKTSQEARRIVKLTYLGLLHRLPETATLEALAVKISRGMKPIELLESVMRSAEFRQQLSLERLEDFLSLLPEDIQRSHDAEAFKFTGSGKEQKIKNIIYLSPAISHPVGGIKVLFRHSQIINLLLAEGIHSEVYFPEAPDFSLDWFEHQTKIKRDKLIKIDEELIVLPEVWALKYGPLLLENNVKYVIFVQNGYSIFDEIFQRNMTELSRLREIYKNSTLVLSVSHDTAQCVQKTFDIPSKKLLIITPSINQNLFTYKKEKKKNIITYMPRKLSNHSNYIINNLLLKNKSRWKIMPIEDVNEKEVAHLLSLSKIFLSFSDREGLALPPIEAALSGNIVIGYTGEGAKEYWSEPIFKEVTSGNFMEFIKLIDIEMTKIESKDSFDSDFEEKVRSIEKLREYFSPQKEHEILKDFIQIVV